MTYPYVSGAVLLASDLNTDFASKTDLAMTQNAQTGTTYSFALADASKLLTTSNASPVSVTVTKQATVTWVTGTQLRIMNLGAGVTTLVADTGVTINGNVALKQYQGGTLIRTASDVWLFVPTASSSGMDLITPTSVAGSGVTLSGGVVTISAATEASVNGCFTSAYSNYVVVMDSLVIAAGNPELYLRLRASGSNTATGYYYAGNYAVFTGATGVNNGSNAAQYVLTSLPNTHKVGLALDVFGPQLSAATGLSNLQNRHDASQWTAGHLRDTTAYDGFSILPASSTVSGVMRIYGRRNS